MPSSCADHYLISASAGVAQLVRAPPCHGGGRGFESRLSRHSFLTIFQWLGPMALALMDMGLMDLGLMDLGL